MGLSLILHELSTVHLDGLMLEKHRTGFLDI